MWRGDELANSACNRGPNSSSSSWEMASRTSFGMIVFLLALTAFSFALCDPASIDQH